MKKVIILSVLILCLSLFIFAGGDDEEDALYTVVDGVRYTLVADSYYAVTGLDDTKRTEIEIKGEVNGKSVTAIADSAFKDCTSLKTVRINDKIVTIGENAFGSCSALESVYIGTGTMSIGKEAFYSCDSLTGIYVSEGNSVYKTIDGSLYSKDGKILARYAIGRTDSFFTIPMGVETIGACAFADADRLMGISISSSVTTVGNYAFMSCYNLREIEIPSSVKSLGSYAFSLCDKLTIFCQAQEKPSSWADNWNPDKCPVGGGQ